MDRFNSGGNANKGRYKEKRMFDGGFDRTKRPASVAVGYEYGHISIAEAENAGHGAVKKAGNVDEYERSSDYSQGWKRKGDGYPE